MENLKTQVTISVTPDDIKTHRDVTITESDHNDVIRPECQQESKQYLFAVISDMIMMVSPGLSLSHSVVS